MSAETADTIRSWCPFRLVADEDVAQLLAECATSTAAAGEVVFEDGETSAGVSALVEGTVEVVKGGRVLGTLDRGAVLGEVGIFLTQASRTATVRAVTPVRLVTWSARDLRDRLSHREPLATAVVADLSPVLAERLDRRTHDVVSLLEAAGRRLPVAELERLRSRVVQ